MFISTQIRRLPSTLALIALALIGLTFAVATSGANAAGSQPAKHRSSERLVVRGEDTVKDRPCPAGVCTGARRRRLQRHAGRHRQLQRHGRPEGRRDIPERRGRRVRPDRRANRPR